MPKFSRELSLMLSTIVQNFKKFRLQVFPKNMFKFQKNQNFTDKFFLNTIPRPKFVTNDNNFLLDNKYGCNWCPHQILAKLVNIWPNYEYPKSRKPSKKKNPQKYKLLLNYLTERHQILCEQYWGFA